MTQPLKEENKILRARLPQRLVATPQEKRRLLKFGRKLGVQLRDLISIVIYQTFVRWIREKEASHAEKKAAATRKPGRPRTPDDIRELVLKLARDNERAGRCLPARVSASLLTPRLDFAEHRATGFSMGQPAGQEFSDGRSRPTRPLRYGVRHPERRKRCRLCSNAAADDTQQMTNFRTQRPKLKVGSKPASVCVE